MYLQYHWPYLRTVSVVRVAISLHDPICLAYPVLPRLVVSLIHLCYIHLSISLFLLICLFVRS